MCVSADFVCAPSHATRQNQLQVASRISTLDNFEGFDQTSDVFPMLDHSVMDQIVVPDTVLLEKLPEPNGVRRRSIEEFVVVSQIDDGNLFRRNSVDLD